MVTMSQLADYTVTITVLAVFCVLLVGLWTMMRGKNSNLSQKMMRWRVGLQFIAVIAIMVAIYIKG